MKLTKSMNVDVTNIMGTRNLWHEIADVRRRFHEDNSGLEKSPESFIYAFYPSHKVVLTRKYNIGNPLSRFENDTAFYELPANPNTVAKIKENGNLIFTPDLLVFVSYYRHDHILDEQVKKELNNVPKQAVMNIVKRYINNTIEIIGNDIILDSNKKFLGSEQSINRYGVFESLIITLEYDKYKDFFNTYLKNDANHINSNRQITGIFDEIGKHMDKEQFMNLLIKEIKTLWKDLDSTFDNKEV